MKHNNTVGGGVRNTRFTYLYRDAGNNKRKREAVIAGHYPGVEREIRGFLHMGEYFKAGEVGFPSAFFWEPQAGEERIARDEQEDHPWHEMQDIEETVEKPTVTGVNIHDIMARFWEASGTGWNADGEGVRPRLARPSVLAGKNSRGRKEMAVGRN